MINSLIAYNIQELNKKRILRGAKKLEQSAILDKVQLDKIKSSYTSNLYCPSIPIRILLFILGLIGLGTFLGSITQLFNTSGETAFRLLAFCLGLVILILMDQYLIKAGKHYKSGITEAGIFSGTSFIYYAILGFDSSIGAIYPLMGMIFALCIAIRYLNMTALFLSVVFFCWLTIQLAFMTGNIGQQMLPFLWILIFGSLFFLIKKIETLWKNSIFEDQFILLKSLFLLLFYFAGNYFIVRNAQATLLGSSISAQEEIPLALFFYLFTAICPIAYIYYGIKQRSILFIRIGLLILGLTILTFKIYFSLGHPEVTITVAGALMILISLFIFRFLKQGKHGFYAKKLIHDKWASENLGALVASQTLGGNSNSLPTEDKNSFKGGDFGGGGASSDW